MSLNKIGSFFLPFAMLCVGLYLVPINIYGPAFSKVPGDLGDARFNNYILEHNYQYFTGKVASYWDAPFMYPYKNVIAFSDNLLGSAPIYAAFRIAGSDRETSYQLWLLSLFVLNFACCYWVLKKESGNTILSSTGAYIYSFSILLVANIYNVQTFPRFIVPLVFYWCWKYIDQKQFRYFIYLGLGIIYQFYCGIYLGFLLLYALLFITISYLIIYRDFTLFSPFKNSKTLKKYSIALIVFAGLFLPFIYPYISISHDAGAPTFDEVFPYIPTLRSYFFTSKAPLFWGVLSDHLINGIKYWWCHFLFIGALPWLGILMIPIVLVRNSTEPGTKKFILFLSLSLFLCFVFCLNINGFTLYKFIYKIPGFSAMRSMNRIINIEVLFFILIFVFAFHELSKSIRIINWLVYLFPLFVILDNSINPQEILTYNKKESQHQINNIVKEIGTQYDKNYKAIAYMPDIIDNPVYLNLDVMLASQELRIPCVNAYSGHNPGHFNSFYGKMDYPSLVEWCDYNHIPTTQIQQIPTRFETIFGKTDQKEFNVTLLAFQDKFVCADTSKGSMLIAHKKELEDPCTFKLIFMDSTHVFLKSAENKFVSLAGENKMFLYANTDSIERAEHFVIYLRENGYFGFKASNGSFLCSDQKLEGKLIANRTYIGDWEKFKIRITQK